MATQNLTLTVISATAGASTCAFKLAKTGLSPFLGRILVTLRSAQVPPLTGQLVTGSDSVGSLSQLFANPAKYTELNSLARKGSGFALQIAYEDSSGSIVTLDGLAIQAA